MGKEKTWESPVFLNLLREWDMFEDLLDLRTLVTAIFKEKSKYFPESNKNYTTYTISITRELIILNDWHSCAHIDR